MSHCGMQSRLMSLPMLTVGQHGIFLCDIFFWRMLCAWEYVVCTVVANQAHRCRTIQVFEWLLIRKTDLVIFCEYMHGQSRCHDWTAFWFHCSGQRDGSECESTHCVIHWEMLAELNNILQDVIKIINHIKVHALNSCLFAQLYEEMDTERTHLLLYTEVR